jgi:hypothetical protein
VHWWEMWEIGMGTGFVIGLGKVIGFLAISRRLRTITINLRMALYRIWFAYADVYKILTRSKMNCNASLPLSCNYRLNNCIIMPVTVTLQRRLNGRPEGTTNAGREKQG